TRGVRLGSFVLVVGEYQVHAAAVYVELGPQVVRGHRRALQMPPRAAVPPRGGPARFARLRLLPQSEIARISFHLGNILALLDLVGTLTGQRAVAVELADREVHIPTRGVGVTPLDQPLDQLHHLRD